jgi:shikimate dehydrogenase
MTAQPDRYVVIGNPVAHSKSPDIHARFATQTGQAMTYERLLAPLDGFGAAVKQFIRDDGKGANVTLPFKLEAFGLATELTERAQAAGAVNTLSFHDGAIVGDNTDGVGLVTDIVSNAGTALQGKKILLLGAGGAARGVLLPILAQRPDGITIANRTLSKAEELAQRFVTQGVVDAKAFLDLRDAYDIVINATSASLSAELPPIPASVFAPQALAYDMMYGREQTVFLRFAARHGALVRDGLGMLIEQAAESFFIWRGVRPATADVFAALRAGL